ncbi:nwd1 [Fusarium napiforme]|uniref:Nwd1 n=1 Tax=Fusarium napiforme TaxID=42672 RepID=A0A8H5NH17_9HYPO|nr:nwd1 [Fusarium napiforme]
MSSNKSSQALRTEVSKIARLSNIQGGLPPLMRGLPVLAVMAGEAIAKTTNTKNMIEERLLGADEVFILQSPQKPTENMQANDG